MLNYWCIFCDFYIRRQKLDEDTRQLYEDLEKWKADVKREVQEVLDKTPLDIKPRKRKVDLDAETPGIEALPPPMLPLVMTNENAGTVDQLANENTGTGDHSANPYRNDISNDSEGDTACHVPESLLGNDKESIDSEFGQFVTCENEDNGENGNRDVVTAEVLQPSETVDRNVDTVSDCLNSNVEQSVLNTEVTNNNGETTVGEVFQESKALDDSTL